ncbi:Protein of unknown function [Jannaschia faecimaris]|uniref:DUF4239 domain-containing protein n=1 Tax=Jannaschia faecimaris TaxID=1244108 RepID=A0A1H3QF93_9RHOB|nr:DUF4239 domain-containing protein [Jannaschia faecimaris]SDZ11399.1 Protein of unknown function [Jannaschia faecimaris]
MSALLGLPVALTAAVSVVFIVLLALGSYWLARRVLGPLAVAETRELAGSVLFRIAALHGLVLALVFAQELGSIRDVKVAAAREAAMLGDVYYDSIRYEAEEETQPVRHHLARYATIVAEEEWAALSSTGRLTASAWAEWEAAYGAILDLEPRTLRQERLLSIMIDDIRQLSELREARENAVLSGPPWLFLMAALSGVALISAAYFTWTPSPLNLTLLSGFAGYTGLIIYFIVAFANPYAPPGETRPLAFERFLSEAVRTAADEAD